MVEPCPYRKPTRLPVVRKSDDKEVAPVDVEFAKEALPALSH